MALHEYDEAALCFKKVLSLDEKNTAVLADIAKLKKAVREYKESRKQMSERMISKLFTTESNLSSDAATKNSVEDAAEHSELSSQLHNFKDDTGMERDNVSSNSPDDGSVEAEKENEEVEYSSPRDTRAISFAVPSIVAFIAFAIAVYYLLAPNPSLDKSS